MFETIRWLVETVQPADLLIVALVGYALEKRIRRIELTNALLLARFDEIVDCHKLVHRADPS